MSSICNEDQKINLKDYISGGIIANGPTWIIGCFLDYNLSLIFVTNLLGGAIAGFLYAGKKGLTDPRAGIYIGAFSYLIYFIFWFFINANTGIINSAILLIGFITGAVLGIKSWMKIILRK